MKYEDMTSKELKAIAKEKKVKDWWTKNKATLIEDLNALEPKINKEPVHRTNLKMNELTYKGETKSIRTWAEELNMPWPTLYDRVNRNGWSVEDAIEIPLGQRRKK